MRTRSGINTKPTTTTKKCKIPPPRTLAIIVIGIIITLLHIQLELFHVASYNGSRNRNDKNKNKQYYNHNKYYNNQNTKKAGDLQALPHQPLPLSAAVRNFQQPPNNRIHKNVNKNNINNNKRCAINLFGLPRSFESLVLPSLTKHVIATNPQCDYFVHYFNLTQEGKGRSSATGGYVHADQIRSLNQVVQSYNPYATVRFTLTNDDDFWKMYETLLNKIHTAKDRQGRYMYFPWKAKTYKFPTTVDNIVKMWHSIQESWMLMKEFASSRQGIDTRRNSSSTDNNPYYARVAMLRSDVVYLTPIRIWEIKREEGKNTSQSSSDRSISTTTMMTDDDENQVAVIPAFARFPVSDRIIYGPYHAVEQWAIHRFDRLEDHVHWMLHHNPGWAMHSERFVNQSIIPHITELGYRIWEHDSLCFLRARVDETVWVTDCWGRFPVDANPNLIPNVFGVHGGNAYPQAVVTAAKGLVERVLGRSCYPGNETRIRRFVTALHCQKTPPL